MENLAKKLVNKLKEKQLTISFMESCTGGYLANQITNIPGTSKVLKVSLVTYSNEYKIKFGVDKKVIEEYTVYSRETAREMAKNVTKFANSNIGVGITGELGKRDLNVVYYSIYNKQTNKYIEEAIDIKGKNREEQKKNISNIIINKILNSTD